MIFDRTVEDAENAIKIRNEKVKNFLELTDEDIEILERGTLTINTLNRIEAKQNVISLMLQTMGYEVYIETKNWDYDNIFDISDFERWLNNLNIIKNAFFVYENTPYIPTMENFKIDYINLNNIEKFLYDVEEICNKVISIYVYSDMIYSGQGVN